MGDHSDGDGVTADLIRDFTRRHGFIQLKACPDCGWAEGTCMCACQPTPEKRSLRSATDEALS